MLQRSRIALISVLGIAVLACGVTNTISGAQSFASTAEALATALPSTMPDVTQYLNPSGKPVSDWNGIPIMSQATAGQEFSKTTYSFKATGITVADVQAFYADKLKALGWTSQFNAQGGGSAGEMLFSKDSSVLSITASTSGQDTVVILITQ